MARKANDVSVPDWRKKYPWKNSRITAVMKAENVVNITFLSEIKKQRFSLNLRKLQDISVCYMFSLSHHGAKEGLPTETF